MDTSRDAGESGRRRHRRRRRQNQESAADGILGCRASKGIHASSRGEALEQAAAELDGVGWLLTSKRSHHVDAGTPRYKQSINQSINQSIHPPPRHYVQSDATHKHAQTTSTSSRQSHRIGCHDSFTHPSLPLCYYPATNASTHLMPTYYHAMTSFPIQTPNPTGPSRQLRISLPERQTCFVKSIVKRQLVQKGTKKTNC